MKLPVYTRSGSEAGREVELDDAVFGLEPNDHVIWLDVRSIQAAGRQGTHKTKERGEVSKSRRKLYRQKGTGNARAGDAKSPLRKGGGTIFGPKPHEYKVAVNRKTKQLARRSAIAHKIAAEAIRIVENVEMDAPKTKEIADLLVGHELAGQKVLFLTDGRDDVLYRSGRNIPKLAVLNATQASTLDLMSAKLVLVEEGAIESLTETLRPKGKRAAEAPQTEEAPTEEAPVAEAPVAEAPVAEAPAEASVEEAPSSEEPTAEAEAPETEDAPEAEAADQAPEAEADAPEADDSDEQA